MHHMYRQLTRSTLSFLLFACSTSLEAQNKYSFDHSEIRLDGAIKEFWAHSPERSIRIKWSHDVWLTDNIPGIDSISGYTALEILDTYDEINHYLRIRSAGTSLHYTYIINGMATAFEPERNQWYLSLFDQVLYPYLKAPLHKRFARKLSEISKLKVGDQFPYFKMPDIKKDMISTGDFMGKISILYFWNLKQDGWIKDIALLNFLREKYPDHSKIQFIAFSKKTDRQIKKALKNQKTDFHFQQIPNSQSLQNHLNIHYWPLCILVDQKQKITYVKTGSIGEHLPELQQNIESLYSK